MIQKLSEEDRATKTLSVIFPTRQLRLGYLIHPTSDIPKGFRIPIPRSEWSNAIFVPGNMACCSRSDTYPSRIYILTHDLLVVFGDVEGNECPFVAKLCDLTELCSHKEPRSGTIAFMTSNFSRSFRYLPVQHQCIDSFSYEIEVPLAALRWDRTAQTCVAEGCGRTVFELSLCARQ